MFAKASSALSVYRQPPSQLLFSLIFCHSLYTPTLRYYLYYSYIFFIFLLHIFLLLLQFTILTIVFFFYPFLFSFFFGYSLHGSPNLNFFHILHPSIISTTIHTYSFFISGFLTEKLLRHSDSIHSAPSGIKPTVVVITVLSSFKNQL